MIEGYLIHRRRPRRSCRLHRTCSTISKHAAFIYQDTNATAAEAGIPTRGTLINDRSEDGISKKIGGLSLSYALTQAEVSTEQNAKNQKGDSDEKVASFSDRWFERTANGTLPDLVK